MNDLNSTLTSLVASATADTDALKAAAAGGELPSQNVTGAGEPKKEFSTQELVYVNNPKYQHLDFIPGSFAQDTTRAGHPYFANKIRMRIRCNCQLEGETGKCTEIVERASSDFHTFMGCTRHTAAMKKIRKAEKAVANLAKK